MTKPTNSADSATRVKAFRERLAGSSYRRVEAYVSTDEKALLDSVKEEMGVTSDVAVAGLLRMGLDAYANGKAAVVAQATPEVATAQSNSLQAQASIQALNFCGSMPETAFRSNVHGAVCAAAASAPTATPALATNQINPIAQFFKSRKETKNA
jgi:hypothetical protein